METEDDAMRMGRFEVQPLGGGRGCAGMVAFSILASVLLTVILNVVLRLF
jgi:hypothetical protein